MIDLVTLIARALSAPPPEEELPEETDYSEHAEEPSERAAATIARALAHKPLTPPGR